MRSGFSNKLPMLGINSSHLISPLMTESFLMGPYKPLLNWVDEFIPYYMENNGSLDPSTYIYIYNPCKFSFQCIEI